MPGASSSKTAIAALGRLLDTASNPCYVLDASRHLLYCNRACCEWIGLANERLLGQVSNYESASAGGVDPISRLAPPPETYLGKPIKNCPVVGVAGDRRSIDFVPLRDGDGDIFAVLAIAEPISPDAEPAMDDSDSFIHAWLTDFHERNARRIPDELVGNAPSIILARQRFDLASKSDANLLVIGPPGAGHQPIARSVHLLRHGAAAAMATLPCPELGEQLLHQTLRWLTSLGEAQSFAGLILSEVDRLGADMQQALVDLLATGKLKARLFGTATGNLTRLVDQGAFRGDLAMRLSVLVIDLPPISQRLEDLPLVAHAMLERTNRGTDKQLSGFMPDALDRLALHTWPRNLAELAEVVESAHRRAEGPLVQAADLPELFQHVGSAWTYPRGEAEPIVLDKFLGEIELELIHRALGRAKGNKTKAAELLGMSRPRFYRRLVQLGLISPGEEVQPGPDDSPPRP